MRVLVSSCPAHGHLFALVPLTWALRTAGHEVLVAIPENYTPVVAAAGLPAVAVDGRYELGDLEQEVLRDVSPPGDPARMVAAMFVRSAERRADDLISAGRRWKADLVLHPPMDYAAPLAAAVLGVPEVHQNWGVAVPLVRDELAAERLGPLHGRYGLPARLPGPALRIDVCPPSLQRPDAPTAQRMRYVPYNGAGEVPAWLLDPPELPRVCVTLSTVEHPHAVSAVRTVIAAIADRGVELVVTMAGRDPDALGPVGPGVRVERWLPVQQVVPGCRAIVHHGGAGTTLTALVYGLPQLALPRTGDQVRHADRLVARGAGLQLGEDQVTEGAVRAAVDALLDDACHRAAADELRREMAGQPPVAEVVGLLEQLAG